ncbi:MAG: hypothetical protein IJ398_02005 [Clostridia bacterium]|nr:hypothetical protein [Clostridia bacterium]
MNFLIKTNESYNSYYSQYKAAWCRKTGLPMYSRKDFEVIEKEGLYTMSRAKRCKVQIDTTKICAWYRRSNGYTPMFKECKYV